LLVNAEYGLGSAQDTISSRWLSTNDYVGLDWNRPAALTKRATGRICASLIASIAKGLLPVNSEANGYGQQVVGEMTSEALLIDLLAVDQEVV
jgi:hypothetical protein